MVFWKRRRKYPGSLPVKGGDGASEGQISRSGPIVPPPAVQKVYDEVYAKGGRVFEQIQKIDPDVKCMFMWIDTDECAGVLQGTPASQRYPRVIVVKNSRENAVKEFDQRVEDYSRIIRKEFPQKRIADQDPYEGFTLDIDCLPVSKILDSFEKLRNTVHFNYGYTPGET